MTPEYLKLTNYLGERDRAGDRFMADALLDLYERRGFQSSLLLRGVEGFGLKHHLRTDRLLSLSEDLPVISIAIDTRERIESALDEISSLGGQGLMTLERVRLPGDAPDMASSPGTGPGRSAKLTVILGRRQRMEGRAAHVAVVDLLHRCGLDGATVLLGVDGILDGKRCRAQFFKANSDVPVMVVAVGDAGSVAEATGRLAGSLPDPPMFLERAQILKRDGQMISDPGEPARFGSGDLGVWQKLTVYAGEQARHEGRQLHPQLVRRLREAGAMGATSIRGIWGFYDGKPPHGDAIWSIRRRAPVTSMVLDSPDRCQEWFQIIDELTDQSGLVTSELVPAMQSLARGKSYGELTSLPVSSSPESGTPP